MNKNTLLKHLATKTLSDASHEAVLKAGSAATPALLQVLRDEDQWGQDEDADGSAALHAAALLSELKAAEAIAPMLDLLQELEPLGAFAQSIVEALGRLGAAALEPTLQRLENLVEEADPVDYLDVLSRCGVQDARIYIRLCDAFKQTPGDTATFLAQYGDTAALPLLTNTLGKLGLVAGEAALDRALDITEIASAIEALGGELTNSLREKVKAAMEVVLMANQTRDFEVALKESGERLLAEAAQAPEETHETPHAHGSERDGDLNRDHAQAHVHGPNCHHDHDGAPQAPRVRTREKLGRNDPCWCESGKKYKKCHYGADQSALY